MKIEKIARISVIIIFIALIRTAAEPFRLQYFENKQLTFHQIKPFLMGVLWISIGLLSITLLSYYNKHKYTIAIAVLLVIGMVLIKYLYL